MGSIFETPLGENLDAALDSRKDDDVATAVAAVREATWAKQLDEEQVQEVVARLQRRAEFDHAVAIGDAAIATRRATVATRRRYSQALIEIGALHAAELELEAILDGGHTTAKEQGEAQGLLGRLRKQRYIASGDPEDLQAAIAAYFEGYQGGTDVQWHGANLLALIARAGREQADLPLGLPALEQLADEVLAEVERVPANQRNIWTRATEVEARVAKGETDAARHVAQDLANSKGVDNFELQSLRRQLLEVWQLEDTDPVILAISDRTLQLGSGATLDLPESPMKLEKILGTALPIGYNNLMKGLRAAESVCKITDAAGEGWGTGFLIRGSLVHESLGDDPILVTNAHVISSIPGESQLQAVEAQAHFEVTKGADGEPLVITGLTEIWTSAIRKRDVTLLRFDTEVPELPQPIEAAPVLPPVTEGAFVYVIGHPAGGGVKFSIRGNDLLSYDPESIKVHYTAPTEGGSSGSPVFSSAWQLMAVHHAGNEQMKRLDDPTKTYKANEGITLESIRAEFEATMNDAPGQGGAVG
ncbi:MAG TPA: serine protease [Acidimicrobiia bacterium]|nr:serine protease [Acidimicrobiia bacterium]